MTTMTMVRPRVDFNVDAMLMYGWVTDAAGDVQHVSNSLQRWIRDHALQAPSANRLLDLIHADASVNVEDFLTSLLDPETETGTPDLVTRYMKRLEEWVRKGEVVPQRLPERDGPYRVILQYQPSSRGAQPLAGARFVRDSATLLVSRWNSDRIDIVVVAIVERSDGGWRIKGYQGQLQEAWIRVSNRVVDGNRAGGIALMARNLSHNIGSHALYWVASGASKEQRNFLNYLQVRMELLAGFATSMPLSPVPAELSAVVQRFSESTLLLNNICRSESVSHIDIDYSGGEHKAVFFGGEIGVHAFYSILENCVRDSAKFAPRRVEGAERLRMHVRATALERFVQIDVYDESGNFDRHGPAIQASLEQLKISDESGKLDPRNWGIKERFICAALLRGYRPEDFPQQETASPETAWLGSLTRSGKRVLELVNVDGNCAWRFYLPQRGAEILLVTDSEVGGHSADVITQTVAEFDAAVKLVTEIATPFVVLDRLPAATDPRILEARLPYRTFTRGDSGGSRFPRVEMSIESISRTALLRQSVQQLTKRPMCLVLAIKGVEQGGELTWGKTSHDPELMVVDEHSIEGDPGQLVKWSATRNLVLIKRHCWPGYREFILNARSYGVEHFELYEPNPVLGSAILDARSDLSYAAYRILEAALTRILIVDERIDLSLNAGHGELLRQRLLLKGIDVRGAEFAAHATKERPPSLSDVSKWCAQHQIVLLHRGVLDKLRRDERFGKNESEAIVGSLEAGGARVVFHSGRMGMADMPAHTKFISLSSVTTWLDHDYSKLQIIDELFSLRRA